MVISRAWRRAGEERERECEKLKNYVKRRISHAKEKEGRIRKKIEWRFCK